MHTSIKLAWLIFTITFTHKVQKCARFSWNCVHSSQPQNRLCVINLNMFYQIQLNLTVYITYMNVWCKCGVIKPYIKVGFIRLWNKIYALRGNWSLFGSRVSSEKSNYCVTTQDATQECRRHSEILNMLLSKYILCLHGWDLLEFTDICPWKDTSACARVLYINYDCLSRRACVSLLHLLHLFGTRIYLLSFDIMLLL